MAVRPMSSANSRHTLGAGDTAYQRLGRLLSSHAASWCCWSGFLRLPGSTSAEQVPSCTDTHRDSHRPDYQREKWLIFAVALTALYGLLSSTGPFHIKKTEFFLYPPTLEFSAGRKQLIRIGTVWGTRRALGSTLHIHSRHRSRNIRRGQATPFGTQPIPEIGGGS